MNFREVDRIPFYRTRIDRTAQVSYNVAKRGGEVLMSQNEEKMFTVKEVADQLRVDEKTVRRWIQRGELIALNVGGGLRPDYRISYANLQDFKLRRQTGGQERD